MQEARNAYEEYIAGKDGKNLDLENTNLCIKSGDYYFHVENGQFKTDAIENETGTCSLAGTVTHFTIANGKLVDSSVHTHTGA